MIPNHKLAMLFSNSTFSLTPFKLFYRIEPHRDERTNRTNRIKIVVRFPAALSLLRHQTSSHGEFSVVVGQRSRFRAVFDWPIKIYAFPAMIRRYCARFDSSHEFIVLSFVPMPARYPRQNDVPRSSIGFIRCPGKQHSERHKGAR